MLITVLITGIICCKLYHRETTTEQDIPVKNNIAYDGILLTDNEAYHINKEWITSATSAQAIDELYDEITYLDYDYIRSNFVF